MVRKLGLAAFLLLLIPSMAVAGMIYASTPTTSPVRGTIAPSGFVTGLNPYTYFTVTPYSGYMINTVLLDNVPLYPLASGPNAGKYAVPFKTTTQRLAVSFTTAQLEQLKAVLPASIFVLPGSSVTINGAQSTVVLNWGKLASYTWSVEPSGPSLNPASGTANKASALTTLFTGSTPGSYMVTLNLSATGLPDSSATTNVIVQTDNVSASKTCLECHQGTNVLPYVSSRHAYNSTKPQYGSTPTCYTCHNPTDPPMPHPGYPLSQVDNVCVTCHREGTFPPDLSFHDANGYTSNPPICVTCHNQHSLKVDPAGLPKPHFNAVTDYSDPNYTAMYVTPRTDCGYCHGTPHRFQNNTTYAAQARHDWARSGKGNANSPAWKNGPTHDWKTAGTRNASPATSVAQDCVRCHVAKGFAQYVGSNYTNISPVGDSSDKTSEPLTCNACHNSDRATNPDFTLRAANNYTAYYNYSSAVTKKLIVKFDQFFGKYYPWPGNPYWLPADPGASNICIACHTGRVSGDTLWKANAAGLNFNNASFMNSHYMSSAGTLYQSTGFKFYTSSRMYGIAGGVRYHQVIDAKTDFNTGGRGPCVGCHTSTEKPHSFAAVGYDGSGAINNISFCQSPSCHDSRYPDFMQTQKGNFKDALAALEYILKSRKGIYYNGDLYPYFYDANGAQFKAWGTVQTMGAAFNLNLLKREGGGWAHNPVYVHRLIWDSIDYIDDGTLNQSVPGTLETLSSQSFYHGARDYLDGVRQ